ncbi:MAG: right-handed parallel beta-helix repeat-containing protein [Reichenbachiella sp.]|uniref:right-handed parallel beta-helix repeat-containing protein n=1 Tax=Reichenbachiella sp. TaxID=2184521 RepID=UPI00329697BA
MEKVNNLNLLPGDSVFFKCGDRFMGHLLLNESGNQNSPIVITSYGIGNKPIISGAVGPDKGGDYQEAILIENVSHYILENLEIQNERKHRRKGVEDKDSYGIRVQNSGKETIRGFEMRNLDFNNIYGVIPIQKREKFNKILVSGIRFESTKNTVVGEEKNIQDVLVEKCNFTNLQRLGIHIVHKGGAEGIGTDSTNRNKNLIFRNNTFYKIGGTCILPVGTYNCLIENNVFDYPGDNSDPRMPGRGSAVWTLRCINTVIQFNKSLHARGYLDSHGIHIDHENVDTFIQYNYMEDCEGGFVEILRGNINAVYRFNISVNDGWRDNPNKTNSNHTIWIPKWVVEGDTIYSQDSYIYNNTIVIDKPFETAITINSIRTNIYNNIFYSLEGTIGGKETRIRTNDSEFFISNNIFHGSINKNLIKRDSNPILADPNFNNPKSGSKFGFQLKKSSPAINSGSNKMGPAIPGAGEGVFRNVPAYPKVDFFGNPVDFSSGQINIGACNSKKGEIVNEEN